MTKQYKEITKDVTAYLSQLRQGIPDVMNGLAAISLSATKDGVLDKKTKELIALALGVAAKCDGCIGFHVQALVQLGVTKEELLEALGMAIYMGGGPSSVFAAYALKAFDEFTTK
jgi:AhpD family alkylhydroperoxidase